MAISTGKNKAKTGINIVPSPNPERKVRMEVKKRSNANDDNFGHEKIKFLTWAKLSGIMRMAVVEIKDKMVLLKIYNGRDIRIKGRF
jgi:hypothetical protein